MRKLKIYVFGLLTLLASLGISSNLYAQQGVKSKRFTIAGPDSAINLVNTSIAWHQLSWTVSGTASVCTVSLDTSTNGTTWTAGGAITGQTCTSNGSSSVVNVTARYVRMNMTALTITTGSSVTVTWDGYTSNPSGGGSSLTATQVGFGSVSNTLTGSANMTFDAVNNKINLFNPTNGVGDGFRSSFNATATVLGAGDYSAFFTDTASLLGRSGYACISTTTENSSDSCLFLQGKTGTPLFGIQNDSSVLFTPDKAPTNTVPYPNLAFFEMDFTRSAVMLTNPAFDLSYQSTTIPQGLFTIRGAGIGSVGGAPTLFNIAMEDSSPWAMTMTNKNSPAGSYFATFFGGASPEYDMSISDGTNTGGASLVPDVTGGSFNSNKFQAKQYLTETNCSSSATPAVCVDAPAGSVAIPTGTTSSTLQVNTTAVTANSQIFFYPDDTLGTKLGSITCNSTLATLVGGSFISARNPGVSFTITFNGTIAVNKVCGSYLIIN